MAILKKILKPLDIKLQKYSMYNKVRKKYKDRLKRMFGIKNSSAVNKTGVIVAQNKTNANALNSKEKITTDTKLIKKVDKPTAKTTNEQLIQSYYDNYERMPIKKGQYFFDSFWGRTISCNPYAIFLAVYDADIKKKNTYIWCVTARTPIPENLKNKKNVKFVIRGKSEFVEALLSSEVLVFNSNLPTYFVKKAGQILVNPWHGIPIKTLGYNVGKFEYKNVANSQRNFNISTIIPISSNYIIDNVLLPFGAELPQGDVILETGSPRHSLIKNTKFNKLEVNFDKKVILYAPTWRGTILNIQSDQTLIMATIDLLKEFAENNGYELYVSLHQLFKKSLLDLKIKLDINEIPLGTDINQFLSVVDILISDYSSITMDFLILNKPVILYVYDLEEYKLEHGFYLELDSLPVSIARTAEELLDSLYTPLKPSSIHDKYDEFIDYFHRFESKDSVYKTIEQINKNLLNTVASKKKISNGKINILVAAGILKDNGITRSFINLLKQIDSSKIRIHTLIDLTSTTSRDMLDLIRKYSNLILINTKKQITESEKISLGRYLKGDVLSSLDEFIVENYYSMNARMYLSDYEFDAAIDYSGYGVFFNNLILYSNAKMKIVYCHSDMYKECNNQEKNFSITLKLIFSNYKKFDKVISVSDSIKRINEEYLCDYIPNEKSDFILNPINYDEVIKYSKYPLLSVSSVFHIACNSPDIPVFTSVSRLSPEKNIALLIHAFSIVVAYNPSSMLFLIGEGIEKDKLHSLVKELNLDNNVIFLGFISNPYPFIKNSDCILSSSLYEGQGLSILESMVLNTFYIASDIPAFREITLDNPRMGVLSELTSEAFASHMINVINKTYISTGEFNIAGYIDKSVTKFLNMVS